MMRDDVRRETMSVLTLTDDDDDDDDDGSLKMMTRKWLTNSITEGCRPYLVHVLML